MQAHRRYGQVANFVAGMNLKSLRGGSVVHANSRYAESQERYSPACGATAAGMSKLRQVWGTTSAPVTCKRCQGH